MEPVLLTDDQINEILAIIPKPPGIGNSAREVSRQQLSNLVALELKNIKLVPDPRALQEFKQYFKQLLYESYIGPGHPIGLCAAIAISAPATQLSLNSFHSAGASSIGTTFKIIKDMITLSDMNRDPRMQIYFKTPFVGDDLHDIHHVGTFDYVFNKRKTLEATMVSDLVLTKYILEVDEIASENLYDLLKIHFIVRPEAFAKSIENYPLTYVAKIKLNTYKMYSRDITMDDVAKAIQGSEPPDSLSCIWKSILDGYMYILVDETKTYGKDLFDPITGVLLHLQTYVFNSFSDWLVKGIRDIKYITPVKIDILSGITKLVADNGTIKAYTSQEETRMKGISLEDIRSAISAFGYPIKSVNKQELYVEYEGPISSLKEMKSKASKIRELVNLELLIQKGSENIHMHDVEEIKKLTKADRTLLEATEYFYASCKGINLKDISWFDDIDLFRTISNYPNDIYSTFGISAVRTFLIFKFKELIIGFSSYVNPRHISIIYNSLTNTGKLNRPSFAGINRKPVGALTLASNQKAMDVFVSAAITGRSEVIGSVSSSLYVGQTSRKIGTGAVSMSTEVTPELTLQLIQDELQPLQMELGDVFDAASNPPLV